MIGKLAAICGVLSLAIALPPAQMNATAPTTASAQCIPPDSRVVILPPNAPTNSTFEFAGQPPLRYREDASTVVEFTSADEVNRRCAGGVPICGKRFLGCRRGNKLIMPHPCRANPESYAALLCHEVAHVNGWPAYHGD
jgi:hypothetical protein